MLKQGIHPKIVSERLGHATTAFTLDTYSTLYQDFKKHLLESPMIVLSLRCKYLLELKQNTSITIPNNGCANA